MVVSEHLPSQTGVQFINRLPDCIKNLLKRSLATHAFLISASFGHITEHDPQPIWLDDTEAGTGIEKLASGLKVIPLIRPVLRLGFLGNLPRPATLVLGRLAVHDRPGLISVPGPEIAGYGSACP
ncbi:hypothetical protein J6590_081171 [Homalodisca vitripennis]|nr:hypothetical protein J6590_081171 [Homalodisca vitripennis]